jgi:hypothetical protein
MQTTDHLKDSNLTYVRKLSVIKFSNKPVMMITAERTKKEPKFLTCNLALFYLNSHSMITSEFYPKVSKQRGDENMAPAFSEFLVYRGRWNLNKYM